MTFDELPFGVLCSAPTLTVTFCRVDKIRRNVNLEVLLLGNGNGKLTSILNVAATPLTRSDYFTIDLPEITR